MEDFLKKFLTLEMGRSLVLELVKCVCTFFIGYFSFKIFERYKNRQEYINLYILLTNLRSDISKNKEVINSALNKNIEIELLSDNFNKDKKFDSDLSELYDCIIHLDRYKEYGSYIDESGDYEFMYFYNEKLYKDIADLENYIYWGPEEGDDIEVLKVELDRYKNMTIYDEFKKIHNKLNELIECGFTLNKSLEFLKFKLEKFNSYQVEEKKRYLDKFCKLILEGKNIFTKSLKLYTYINDEKKKLCKKEIELSFSPYDIKDINLIAIYDLDLFTDIRDFLKKFDKLLIKKEETSVLEETLNLICKFENKIDKSEKKFKNILDKKIYCR